MLGSDFFRWEHRQASPGHRLPQRLLPRGTSATDPPDAAWRGGEPWGPDGALLLALETRPYLGGGFLQEDFFLLSFVHSFLSLAYCGLSLIFSDVMGMLPSFSYQSFHKVRAVEHQM